MIVFLLTFIALLCISAPIIVALGGCSLVYALLSGNMPITTLIQTVFGGLATFPLLAIPLFMLAGNLMNEGGITQDLVRFARLLLGHIRGGPGPCHDPGLRHLCGDLRGGGGHGGGHRRGDDPGHEQGRI